MEAQKQALAQASKVDEEQKKEIHRLHAENLKLTSQVENIEDKQYEMSSLEETNQRLRKDASQVHSSATMVTKQVKKLATELEFFRSENIELKELLKDKEQLTETIQYLVSENKKYRKEQEEMQQLLEDAKSSAAELRFVIVKIN